MKKIENHIALKDRSLLKRKTYLSFAYHFKPFVLRTHHQPKRRELAWSAVCITLFFSLICVHSLSFGFSLNPERAFYMEFREDSISETHTIRELGRVYKLGLQKRDDSLKYRKLSEIAFKLTGLKDTVLFPAIAKQAMQLAISLEDELLIADADWNYGAFYLQKRDYENSYYHYDKAYKIFTTHNNPYYAGKMLYNLAFISSQLSDYTGAEILLYDAIKNFEIANKPKQLYLCYNQLGAIAYNLQEYENARNHYVKASKFINSLSDPTYHEVELWNNMGVMYQKLMDYNMAHYYFDKGINQGLVKHKRPSLYAKLLDNKAYTDFLMGNQREILIPMHLAMNLRDSLEDMAGAVISRIHLSKVYAKNGDTMSAISYAKKGLVLAEKNGLNRDVLATLEILSELEPDQRAAYLKRHIDLNKELSIRERGIRNKFTAIRFETEKYMDENEKLFRQRSWIIASSIIFVMFFLFIYGNSRQRAKNKALVFEKELQQHNEDIFLLALENKTILERGRNLERLRISEELHDGILARLFSIRFKWSFLELTGNAKTIIQHKKSIEELLGIETDIRNISHDLRNELIWRELEFIEEIENNIRERSEYGGFQYTFQNNGELQWEALDYLSKTNISRMLDEILLNVVKHAKASHVIIEFNGNANLLSITVKDNGNGFKVNSVHKGIGLKNLINRAKKIKSEVTITSRIGFGTSIVILIPKKP